MKLRSIALVAALSSVAPSWAALEELPRPALESFEPAARGHLEAERRALDDALARAAEPAAQAEAFGHLGLIYYGYELYEPAAIAWDNALYLQPEDGRWLYLSGLLQRIEGEWQGAADRLARAVAVDPDNLAARIHLGRVLLDLGDEAAAEEQFLAVRESRPGSAAAALGLARVALAESRFEEAVQWSRRVLAVQPQADVAHHHMGLAYRSLGDRERALRHLSLSHHRDVVFPDPLTDGLAQLLRGAAIQAKHGVEALRVGRYELAAGYFERAAAIDDEDPSHLYNLGVSLREMGSADRAVAEFRKLVERFPEHRDGHFNLAAMLARGGDVASAALHYQRAAEIDPEDREARIEWAAALSHLGRFDQAQGELEAMVGAYPSDASARVALATLLLQRRSPEGAIEVLEAGLDQDVTVAEWATLQRMLGEAATAGRDLDGAESAFRAALERQPDSVPTRLDLGRLLARRGDYTAAVEHFRYLVEVEPSNVEFQASLGLALLLAGDDVATLAELEAATEAVPRSTTLLHLLARLLAASADDSVRDGERALRLARQVMEAEPTVEHAETVAMALAAAGDFATAASWQQRVVSERTNAGDAARALRSRERLESYLAGHRPPPPWSGGEP